MIFLSDIDEKLEITTSSAADIDYQSNWVDVIPTTSAIPGSTQGKITSATIVDLIPSPAASTVRQIKSISIRNRHATDTNTISINKNVASVQYLITADIVLGAGEIITYEDTVGWSKGSIIINTLTNDIHLGYQDWNAISNPAVPPSDTLRLYSKKISGRTMPKWTPPSGMDTPFQPALFGNNIVLWQPGLTSGVLLGSSGTAITAGVSTLPSVTNKYTSLRRSVFTVATGINLMNSYRSDAMFFRGAVPGMGGFFFFCRFGFNVWTTTNRFFVGFAADTTTLLTADPSTKFNILGFGVDTADTAISFIHNDASGAASKEPIPGQPALTTANVYDAYIYCKPNDTNVYYRLDDLSAGVTIIDSVISTNLPVATTNMTAVCGIGSGATNSGAAVASFGLNRLYIESDF